MGFCQSRRISVCFLMSFFIFIIAACADNTSQGKIQKLEAEVDRLQKEIDELKLETTFLKIFQNPYKSAVFDPSETKGYGRLDTTSGFFLFSITDIKPYLDGYKIVANVGNPSAARYIGFALKAKWGTRFDVNKAKTDKSYNYDSWHKTLTEKDIRFTETLKPSTWNKVSFVVSPAKPDAFGYLEISMTTDTVGLIQGK
jgi:hypothetical protein